MSSQKSFTLIELLVVIAITGLISSIVLVSLDVPAKKQKARIVKSLSFSQSIQNVLGFESAGIWDIDEESGSVAKDSSGNGTDGTINGSPSYTSETPHSLAGEGGNKRALFFNGSTDYIQISTSKIGTRDQLTVEAWVLPYGQIVGAYNYHKDIVRSDCYGGGMWGISTDQNFNDNGQLSILVGWITSGATWKSPGAVKRGEWNHLVLSMDRTDGKAYFYIDGKLIWSGTEAVGSKPTTAGLAIGSDCAGSFKGVIDNVRVYNKSLTSVEIQRHYAEGLEKYNL